MPTKKRPNGRASVERGKVFEREVAGYFEDATGLSVRRTSISQPIFGRRKGAGNADLIGTPHLAVECKRLETINFRDVLAQAERNATGGDIPIVVNRRNRETIHDSVVALRLSTFMHFYRIFLMYLGAIKRDDEEPQKPQDVPKLTIVERGR